MMNRSTHSARRLASLATRVLGVAPSFTFAGEPVVAALRDGHFDRRDLSSLGARSQAQSQDATLKLPLPCYWSNEEPTRGSLGPPPVPELIVSRVSCLRNDDVIFRDVNLTVHEGGAVLLTGPNGSGKSTMLRLLAGFLRPSAGYVMWRGHDVSNADVYDLFRINVHLVAQKDAIKEEFTVDTNVRLWARMDGTSERVEGALERMGLSTLANEPSSILSLGQRKRLQLSRLLAMPRSIWLLDEPTVGLDSQGVAILEDAIEEHRRCGGIALVATHTPIHLSDCMHLKFASRR